MWKLTSRQEGFMLGVYITGFVGAAIALAVLDAGSSAIEWTLLGWTLAWVGACTVWHHWRFNRSWRECRRNPVVRPD